MHSASGRAEQFVADRGGWALALGGAAVAGAVAGAVVGNAIQNRAGTGYNIVVRTSDGRILTAMQDDLGAIRVGSYVEVRNGRAYLR